MRRAVLNLLDVFAWVAGAALMAAAGFRASEAIGAGNWAQAALMAAAGLVAAVLATGGVLALTGIWRNTERMAQALERIAREGRGGRALVAQRGANLPEPVSPQAQPEPAPQPERRRLGPAN